MCPCRWLLVDLIGACDYFHQCLHSRFVPDTDVDKSIRLLYTISPCDLQGRLPGIVQDRPRGSLILHRLLHCYSPGWWGAERSQTTQMHSETCDGATSTLNPYKQNTQATILRPLTWNHKPSFEAWNHQGVSPPSPHLGGLYYSTGPLGQSKGYTTFTAVAERVTLTQLPSHATTQRPSLPSTSPPTQGIPKPRCDYSPADPLIGQYKVSLMSQGPRGRTTSSCRKSPQTQVTLIDVVARDTTTTTTTTRTR